MLSVEDCHCILPQYPAAVNVTVCPEQALERLAEDTPVLGVLQQESIADHPAPVTLPSEVN